MAATGANSLSVDKSCKIFIGSIPYTVTEEELRKEISQYGSIVNLFYMQDQAQQNRGWSLVSYQTTEEARNAILSMDGKLQFPGSDRAVEVRFADKKPEKVEHTPAYNNPVVPRPPSVWIEYFTADKHPYYYNTVTGLTQWERPPEMDLQASALASHSLTSAITVNAGGNSSYGPRGSNLFIFHLPSDWNDIDLIQHFQHFGNIRSARIQRDGSGRNRGFGFVSFDNVQSARNAIRGMNGFSVGGKYLKVKVKKGEEDANDEGQENQYSMGMFPTAVPGMAAAYQYGQVSPQSAQQMAMYAATMRPHIPHYTPY